MLGREIRDVDLVIEGDADAFARQLALHLGASVRVHPRFATATLLVPGAGALDVAATRRERYEQPGALPTVIPGAPIEEDLGRRDFTVNAMAVALRGRGSLLDPLGGREDLSRGLVRALHSGSFLDDPTRALRAVRYGNRLDFRTEPATRGWLRSALEAGALERLSADRLRREVRLVLEEPRRAAAVARMEALALDAAIHPALRRREGTASRLRRAELLAAGAETTWLCYLLAWMGSATVAEVRDVALRLGISGAQGRRFLAWPETAARFSKRLVPSALRRAARGLSADELVAAAAGLGVARGRTLLAAASEPDAALPVRGQDLLAAGVPPGPAIGRALERTRAAIEDGSIAAADALAFALSAAREGGA